MLLFGGRKNNSNSSSSDSKEQNENSLGKEIRNKIVNKINYINNINIFYFLF